MPATITYIAWLRAINVGGNRMVKMDALQKIFEQLGCTNVRTLINSGNVVFAHDKTPEVALRARIETTLKRELGFDVATILRTAKELEHLVKTDPFKNVRVDANMRLYVTFLAEKPTAAAWKTLQDLATPEQTFSQTDRELCTVYRKAKAVAEPFSNALMEKVLGTRATTRNWNTVQKMHNIALR